MSPAARSTLSFAAALALALGVATLAAALVAAPLYTLHRRADARLAGLHAELAHLQRIAAARPALEAKLAALKAREPAGGLLRNAGAALAGSELQELARAAIETNGGRVQGMLVKPHQDEGRFRRIVVNVQFNANAAAQLRVLRALEGGKPYLVVENAVIRSSATHAYRAAPGVEPEHSVQLDLVAAAPAGADR